MREGRHMEGTGVINRSIETPEWNAINLSRKPCDSKGFS